MARVLPPHLLTYPALLGCLIATCGCVQHRTAVHPPTPAAPSPTGEPAAVTQVIAGAKVVDEPKEPITSASPLPIDLPVSAWRRDSDGPLSRAELRVTTARPWWQRFPADAVSDLAPIDAGVDASGTVELVPVPTVDRARLFADAERDGYAHRGDPPKKPGKHDAAPDAKATATP
jgi:hypothetical protein